MHELSVCRGLLAQVARIAEARGARRVTAIRLRIGPLSGVEPELLAQAFPVASAGTPAEGARLVTDIQPLRVRCEGCGRASRARAANDLRCRRCGDWRTRLVSGDELLLAEVELETGTPTEGGAACATPAAAT